MKKAFVIIICMWLAALCITGCGAPASAKDAEEAFSFIYMSDTQADPGVGDYTAVGELLDKALAHESAPRLIVLGGDSVNDGSSAAEWADFWAASDGITDDVTIAAVAGNHDSGPLLAEQFDYPETTAEGYFYTFTEGNVFFLMLDSNIMGGGNRDHALWIEEQLASESAKNADWRIAVAHHPLWPVADIPKDIQRAQTMRDVYLPSMEGKIDLFLCGHQHSYARATDMGIGFIQIMAASGAKGSYKAGDMEYIITTAEAPNYLIIEAGAKALDITSFDSAGSELDGVSVIKEAGRKEISGRPCYRKL